MHEDYQRPRQATGHEFLSGLFFGAVVGAAVGLLFAPRSGAEMRGQVAGSASRLRKQAGETYERASSVVHEAVDRGREAWHQGRERYDEARHAVVAEVQSVVNKQTPM